MKKVLLILLAAFIATSGTITPAQAKKSARGTIRLCTYNIRGDKPVDGINQWQYRKDSLCQIILRHDFDIICLQEAVQPQLEEIEKSIGYAFVGIRGLNNPIFYKASRYELLHTETFWLSESMAPCSVGWDGKYDRYCTWAKFCDRKSGEEFFVFNTHFDHRGVAARREAAALLCAQARKYAADAPTFICGDLNSLDTTEAYRTMTTYYSDSHSLAPQLSGPEGTAHNFGKVEPIRIDYIFVNDKIRITRYGVEDEQYPGGFYPSDHYAVYVHATIDSKPQK